METMIRSKRSWTPSQTGRSQARQHSARNVILLLPTWLLSTWQVSLEVPLIIPTLPANRTSSAGNPPLARGFIMRTLKSRSLLLYHRLRFEYNSLLQTNDWAQCFGEKPPASPADRHQSWVNWYFVSGAGRWLMLSGDAKRTWLVSLCADCDDLKAGELIADYRGWKLCFDSLWLRVDSLCLIFQQSNDQVVIIFMARM